MFVKVHYSHRPGYFICWESYYIYVIYFVIDVAWLPSGKNRLATIRIARSFCLSTWGRKAIVKHKTRMEKVEWSCQFLLISCLIAYSQLSYIMIFFLIFYGSQKIIGGLSVWTMLYHSAMQKGYAPQLQCSTLCIWRKIVLSMEFKHLYILE